MIEFLENYQTESLPPEVFKKGEQLTRSETSERYFVGRGLAGYVVNGKLVDADHRLIAKDTVTIEIVRRGERRTDLAARAGEIMTGQPPRATPGPGTPFVETAAGPEGTPPVVLEAEVERLKAALQTGNDLFRDMNSSHVETADALRIDVDRLTGELAGAKATADTADALRLDVDRLTGELADANATADTAIAARDEAVKDLAESRTQHDSIVGEYKGAREELDRRGDRIAELERQLAETTKPAKAK